MTINDRLVSDFLFVERRIVALGPYPSHVQLWIENDKKRAAHEKGKGPKRQFYVQQTENQKQAGH
jgi:hypothetical protein